MIRSSTCHDHRLYQHTERTDCNRDKYKHTKWFQFWKCDIFKFLPCACMIHLSCFIKRRVNVLESTKENDHLISDTLPYTHNCDGWKCLFRTVNKWLCTDPQMSKQCIQDSFRTVDIHPECGYNRQRHNNRNKKCHFEVFLTMCDFVYRKCQNKCSDALTRYNNKYKFYRVKK